MSIRCAVCGSKRVTLETKQEGYDLKKGIVGTALIGAPGALAGINGNKVTYYHCADCGHVLNSPMSSIESDWIDKLLDSPTIWKKELEEKKEKYKNIEWEEMAETKFNANAQDSSKSPVQKLADEILIHLKNTTTEKESVIKNRLSNLDAYNSAVKQLEMQGTIQRENIGGENYLHLITDICEMKALAVKNTSLTWAENCSEKIYVGYEEMFLNKALTDTQYSFDDIKMLLYNTLYGSVKESAKYLDVDNLHTWDGIAISFLRKMIKREKVYKEKDFYLVRKSEESENLYQKKLEAEKAQKRKENSVVIAKVLRFLNLNDTEMYTQADIQKYSSDIYETTKMVMDAINCLVEDGKIEKIVKKKKSYFALPGVEERIKEKKEQQEMERKQRHERIKKQNDEIKKYNKEIKANIEELEEQRSEAERIYEANKNKILGAGAKAKKQALLKIAECNEEIDKQSKNIKPLLKYT